MKKWIIVFLGLILFYGQAKAESDTVVQGMDKLKLNSQNARGNYEQYKENHKITSENVGETKKAIKDLTFKKSTLVKNSQNIDKNKKKMDKMKLQITQFKSAEEAKMQKDLAEVAKLQDLLDRLNANIKQREANILAYENKMQEIDQEKENWDIQRQQMNDIKKAIDLKVAEVRKEQKLWTQKREQYKKEMKKWSGEYKTANSTLKKYDKLNSDNN